MFRSQVVQNEHNFDIAHLDGIFLTCAIVCHCLFLQISFCCQNPTFFFPNFFCLLANNKVCGVVELGY